MVRKCLQKAPEVQSIRCSCDLRKGKVKRCQKRMKFEESKGRKYALLFLEKSCKALAIAKIFRFSRVGLVLFNKDLLFVV